jgi:hypothetical protein
VIAWSTRCFARRRWQEDVETTTIARSRKSCEELVRDYSHYAILRSYYDRTICTKLSRLCLSRVRMRIAFVSFCRPIDQLLNFHWLWQWCRNRRVSSSILFFSLTM